jgi:hypothetical protein
MSDRKPLLVFIIFIALMAGVILVTRDGSSSNDNASGPDDSTVETTSTTVIGNQSTVTTVAIPIPTTVPNAGPDQWRSIFDRLIALQNDMLQSPDPARVDEIMDPTCACYSETRTALQTLQDRKWHVQGPTTNISVATLVSKTDTQMRISATLARTDSPTVDEAGKVQQQGKRDLLDPILYVLKKNSSGTWVIADRETYEER